MRTSRRFPYVPGLSRRGLIALIAMIALMLVSMIGASLLRTALAHRQHAARERLRLQAEWLAESGLERAAARLRHDADYAGETWTLPAGELPGEDTAAVEIRVERIDDQTERRTVTATADYPADTPQRARITRSVPVDLRGDQ